MQAPRVSTNSAGIWKLLFARWDQMAGRLAAQIVVSLYAYVLKPLLGGGGNCRFVPSCSEYALSVIAEFGILRGSRLAFRRLASCRPGGGMGWDPPGKGRQHNE